MGWAPLQKEFQNIQAAKMVMLLTLSAEGHSHEGNSSDDQMTNANIKSSFSPSDHRVLEYYDLDLKCSSHFSHAQRWGFWKVIV